MPLRIGYYLSSNAIGGLERHVLTLIDHLRRAHPIAVFCDAAEGSQFFFAELKARGLSPRILRAQDAVDRGVARPIVTSLPVILAARRAMAAAELDVIHFHAGQLGLMYAPVVASSMAGIRTRILTLHNPILEHGRLRRFIETRVLGRLSRVVAVSNHTKNELVQKKGVAPERVEVIPNGIELGEFDHAMERGEARRALGLAEEDLVVGLVGRLHRLKGIDLLIEAVPLARARAPRIKVVLLGSGPEEEPLRRLAEARGVTEAVLFAGYRSDARRLMPAFDALVLPSRDESQSIALLEAMACRKAVVAARVGGVPEVVVDGVTGILFPAENVPALAEALVALLNDPQKRAVMGGAGRARVRDRFAQDEMLRQTLSLYDTSAPSPAKVQAASGSSS
ncbi:MAG TPA: glycosyltransferase [Candidatus Binatia bacterium]